jgi:3-oxoadipate enol-lactonase
VRRTVPLPPETAAGTARGPGGTRIAWRAYGEGEPVLMIMGLMGSGRAWFRLLPHIAERRRAVVVDNRGTGDSERPFGLWTMRDLAGDAIAAMDAAGLDSAHVIGASMGGMIAQHVGVDHPERVRSLVLACTHAGGRSPGGTPWRMLASTALRPMIGLERTFPLVAPLLYSERARADRERMAGDLDMRVQDATPLQTWPGQIAAIVRHDVRDRVGRLDLPVLVLHGEEDRLVPPEAGRRLAELIPGARFELIPGAGHVMTTDAEREVAGAITGFLDEVERAGNRRAAASR